MARLQEPSFPSAEWVVEEGTLRHVKGQGGGDIVTTDQYDNFDFQLEWKISPAGNSGIEDRKHLGSIRTIASSP